MKRNVLLALILTLAACGYSPVYKQIKGVLNEVSVGDVSMISLARLPGERRIAQLANRKLSQVFTSGVTDAKYFLSTHIEESKRTLAVLRDATEDRFEISLTANLVLEDDKGKKLFERDISASSPYNVETSPYGTDAARDRARENAAISLTEEIVQQINYFLYTQK